MRNGGFAGPRACDVHTPARNSASARAIVQKLVGVGQGKLRLHPTGLPTGRERFTSQLRNWRPRRSEHLPEFPKMSRTGSFRPVWGWEKCPGSQIYPETAGAETKNGNCEADMAGLLGLTPASLPLPLVGPAQQPLPLQLSRGLVVISSEEHDAAILALDI
jgi:hypothetical protein